MTIEHPIPSSVIELIGRVGKAIPPDSSRELSTVLREVAERAGISSTDYFALVEGSTGEVPAAFDQDARTVLVEATRQVSSILRYSSDIGTLSKILDQMEMEEDGNISAVNSLRRLLIDVIKLGDEGIRNLLLTDETERKAVEEFGFEGTLDAIIRTITESRVGNEINLQYIASDEYRETLRSIALSKKGIDLTRDVGLDRWTRQADSQEYRRFLRLERVLAQKLAQEYLEGRKSALLNTGAEYHTIIVAIRPYSERVQSLANLLIGVGADSVIAQLGPQDTANDMYPYQMAMIQRGVVQGILASEQGHVLSPNALVRRSFNLGAERLTEPSVEEAKDGREIYEQACVAGYIAGLTDRGDLLGDKQKLLALRSMYKYANEPFKESLAQSLQKMKSEDSRKLIVAIVLGDESFLNNSEKEEYQKLQTELVEIESTTHKEAVRGLLYEGGSTTFMAKDLHRPSEIHPWGSLAEHQKTHEEMRRFIMSAEVNYGFFHALITLRIKRGETEPTWADVEFVLQGLSTQREGVTSAGRMGSIFEGDRLTPTQKRLAGMMRIAAASNGIQGQTWERTKAIRELHEQQIVTPEDILDAHNAALIAVEAGNRAYLKHNPAFRNPPLDFASHVESLMTEKTNSKPSGPFAEGEERLAVIPTGEQVGGATAFMQRSYYGVNSHGNRKMDFYRIGETHSLGVEQVLLEVETGMNKRLDTFSSLTDRQTAEKFPTNTFSLLVGNPPSLSNFSGGRYVDRAKLAGRQTSYGWGEDQLKNPAFTDIARSIAFTETGAAHDGSFTRELKKIRKIESIYRSLRRALSEMENPIKKVKTLTLHGHTKVISGKDIMSAAIQDYRGAFNQQTESLVREYLPPQLEGDILNSEMLTRYRASLDTWFNQHVDAFSTTLTRFQVSLKSLPDMVQQVITNRVEPSGTIKFVALGYVEEGPLPSVESTTPILQLPMVGEGRGEDSMRHFIDEVDIAAIIPGIALQHVIEAFEDDKGTMKYSVSGSRYEGVRNMLMTVLGNTNPSEHPDSGITNEKWQEMSNAVAEIHIILSSLADLNRGRLPLQQRLSEVWANTTRDLVQSPVAELRSQLQNEFPPSMHSQLLDRLPT